jgi:isopenicillin N synthase-like dioxygenase
MNIFKALAVTDPGEATRAIPVIDLTRALAGDVRGIDAVARQVQRASEQVGFFYLAGHGVPPALVDAAFAAAREFHAIPLEDRLRLRLDENNIGYLAVNQSMQRHSTVHHATRPNYNESFFISHDRGADHPAVAAGTPLRGRNQWPAGHEAMRATMVRYFETLVDLGQRMLPVLSRALDMPAGFFGPFFGGEPHANLRFLHYPARSTAT